MSTRREYKPLKNTTPSRVILDRDGYLIDTCVWIDIATSIYIIRSIPHLKKSLGFDDIHGLLKRIGIHDKKLYCSQLIKKEYMEKMNDPNKSFLYKLSNEVKNHVFEFMISLQETYLLSNLKRFLIDEPLGNDREIFLSGKSKIAGNVITQNREHFKLIFDQMYDIYNPDLYECTKDDFGIYNGLHLFRKHRPINEWLYSDSIASRLLRLMDSIGDYDD